MQTTSTKTKSILLSLLLLTICFFACGCASVNFVTYHNSDGSITECVYLAIDEQALIKHGENLEQISLEIPSDCYLVAKNLLDEYKNKLNEQLRLNLITTEEFTPLYSGIEIIQQDYTNGEYSIGFKYTNSSVYNKYYELLNNKTQTTNTSQTKKLFYTKTYYHGTANYGDYSIFGTIYNYYSNSRFSSISPQENMLTYTYSVTSRRFHSDANKIQADSSGNYLHTWNISPDEPNKQICFYTISANKSMWIIVCSSLSLLTTIFISIIALIKHKQQNPNKPLDNLSNIDNNISTDNL